MTDIEGSIAVHSQLDRLYADCTAIYKAFCHEDISEDKQWLLYLYFEEKFTEARSVLREAFLALERVGKE